MDLELACMNGDFELGAEFIKAGADIHFSEEGYTPLIIAGVFGPMSAGDGHDKLIALLADSGADVNVQMDDGRTPLLLSTHSGYMIGTKALILHKADVNCQDEHGNTACINLVRYEGCLELLTLLVDSGADLGLARVDGNTVFTFAASSGDVEVLEYLAPKVANIHVRDKDGNNAVMLASLCDRVRAVAWLAEKGADLDARDEKGNNCLMLACWDNNLDTALHLARLGVSPHLSNTAGFTAISHYAKNLDLEEGAELNADTDYPPLSAEIKLERTDRILAAYALYVEEKRKEDCWQRRKHALLFLAGTSVQLNLVDAIPLCPMAAKQAELAALQLQHDPSASIVPVDRSTPLANRAYLLQAALGQDGLQRRIVGLL